MAMPVRKPRRPPPPLDAESLQSMALRYVERFATSRAKLTAYLVRKLRERGWSGGRDPDVDALVARFSDLGYVDDRSFALSKARSLTVRGMGARRVRQALYQAGIEEADRPDADALAEQESIESALRFAKRKRLGPYATVQPDQLAREKALAAMVRAGHSFDLARRIIHMDPNVEVDPLNLG